MTDMKLLHSMRELAVNPHGLCALSPSNDNPFLAYPGSSITGEIQLFNTIALVRGKTKDLFFFLRFIVEIDLETDVVDQCT